MSVAVGSVTKFAAVEKDVFGNVLTVSPAFVWAVDNPALASVDAEGNLTALDAVGLVRLTAAAGNLVGELNVEIVEGAPASIVIAPA